MIFLINRVLISSPIITPTLHYSGNSDFHKFVSDFLRTLLLPFQPVRLGVETLRDSYPKNQRRPMTKSSRPSSVPTR